MMVIHRENFIFFNRNGEKNEPQLPDRFDAPLFYLRFTPDNKILALFIGQKSDKPYTKEINNSRRQGSKVKKYTPLLDIEVSSYLMLYDIENGQINWVSKVDNINEKIGLMNLNYFSMGKSFYVLKDKLLMFFDDIFDESRILCYDYNDGSLIWQKVFDSSLGINSNTFSEKNNNILIVESMRGHIYEVDVYNQKINTIWILKKVI